MPLRVRAFSETMRVKVPAQNERAAKALLIEAARGVRGRVVREQQARASVAPDVVQIVDRRRGAPIETVRGDGVVVFEFHYMREIATEALRLLRERGPQLSGDWKRSLTVFVEEAEAGLEAISERTRLVQIAPLVIYARRLEIGRDAAGGPFIVNAPPHLVQETALMLAQTYRPVADIRHGFVEAEGGRVAKYRRRRGGRAAAQPMRYPAIVIRARDPAP